MVTATYLVMTIISALFVSWIDTNFYDVTLLEAFLYIFKPQIATRESYMVGAKIAALLTAVVIDYRVWKSSKKATANQIEGK